MTDTQSIADQWMDALQQHGFRQTRSRRVIVETILNTPYGMEPLEIYQRGHQTYASLGMVTVYRTLETLTQLGLIERVHRPHGCNLYIRATVGHQHLLVCQDCGKVTYFEGDDLSALIKKVEKQSRFKITEHWLQFFGKCPECRTAQNH